MTIESVFGGVPCDQLLKELRVRILNPHSVVLGLAQVQLRLSLPNIAADIGHLIAVAIGVSNDPENNNERMLAVQITLSKLVHEARKVYPTPVTLCNTTLEPSAFFQRAKIIDFDSIPFVGKEIIVRFPAFDYINVFQCLEQCEEDTHFSLVAYTDIAFIITPIIARREFRAIDIEYCLSQVFSLAQGVNQRSIDIKEMAVLLGKSAQRDPMEVMVYDGRALRYVKHAPFLR